MYEDRLLPSGAPRHDMPPWVGLHNRFKGLSKYDYALRFL
jgi:hypothetical protein